MAARRRGATVASKGRGGATRPEGKLTALRDVFRARREPVEAVRAELLTATTVIRQCPLLRPLDPLMIMCDGFEL